MQGKETRFLKETGFLEQLKMLLWLCLLLQVRNRHEAEPLVGHSQAGAWERGTMDDFGEGIVKETGFLEQLKTHK